MSQDWMKAALASTKQCGQEQRTNSLMVLYPEGTICWYNFTRDILDQKVYTVMRIHRSDSKLFVFKTKGIFSKHGLINWF